MNFDYNYFLMAVVMLALNIFCNIYSFATITHNINEYKYTNHIVVLFVGMLIVGVLWVIIGGINQWR